MSELLPFAEALAPWVCGILASLIWRAKGPGDRLPPFAQRVVVLCIVALLILGIDAGWLALTDAGGLELGHAWETGGIVALGWHMLRKQGERVVGEGAEPGTVDDQLQALVVGRALRDCRGGAALSLQTVAAALHITVHQLSEIESGRRLLTHEQKARLARVLPAWSQVEMERKR